MFIYRNKMPTNFSQSQNYVWNCQLDRLGEGAFGTVYCGTHKKSGEKVAIKTFKHIPQIFREIEVLKTLKHQYIIQLLNIEQEESSQNQVMIMEFCNGGNLMNFLNEPENLYGLLDDEFLLVLEHLSRGLEYLKRHNVIHRDVKPDNIMRHIRSNGRTVYKLADFGAARELPEGQNFKSLHGTEAYLNPQMFRACFSARDKQVNREFGSNTDLWSIGVTLYHIATGNLPFPAYDRRLMLKVYDYMEKSDGCIAASINPNGQLIFQTTLPQSCRLSYALQKLITPIIAGLFILKSNTQWSFIDYYNKILEVVSRKVIDVFYVNKMHVLKAYIKPDETFDKFQECVYQETKIDKKRQMFLYERQVFFDSFDNFHNIDTKYLFLIDHRDINVQSSNYIVDDSILSNFVIEFMSDKSTGDDMRRAHLACKHLCIYKKIMENMLTIYHHFDAFIKEFDEYRKEEFQRQHKSYETLLDKFSVVFCSLKIIAKYQSTIADSVYEIETKTTNFRQDVIKFFENIDVRTDKNENDFSASQDSNDKMVRKELKDMKTLTKNLINFVDDRRLYYYEKVKIVHCVRTVVEIVENQAIPKFVRYVNEMKDWYKNIFLVRCKILTCLKKSLYRYSRDLKRYEQEIFDQSEASQKAVSRFEKASAVHQALITHQQNNVDTNFIVDSSAELTAKFDDLLQTLDHHSEISD